MGLWLVQECRRAWLREGDAPEYPALAELARTAPSGAVFDPDLPELLAPGDMPARIRAACASAGQDVPGDAPALMRAIFDSLACKYRLVLEQIEAVTGREIDCVHVIGGGSQNHFLCQLTANVTRRVVRAGPAEAAALGNVLVQLHAFGDVASLEEMRDDRRPLGRHPHLRARSRSRAVGRALRALPDSSRCGGTNAMTPGYDLIAETLAARGDDVDRVEAALRAQELELPSWAFGNSGTRFAVFSQPGVPRDPFEKLGRCRRGASAHRDRAVGRAPHPVGPGRRTWMR